MNKCLLLKVTIALFAVPSLAVAQGVCETVNRILDSGINNRFAAVAGLYLPNANECRSWASSSDLSAYAYECIWGDKAAIERVRELRREHMRLYDDMRGELRQDRRDRLISSGDLDRLLRDLEKTYEEGRRTADALDESFSSEAKRESGNLYQAMYGCFQTGAIADATAYNLTNNSDDDGNDWTWSKPAGCSMRISSDHDTRLRFVCPVSTQ